MKIETIDAQDSGGVLLHVMPGGHMMCLVAGVGLYPTPQWLCRQVALQMARQQLYGEMPNPVCSSGCSVSSDGPSEDALYREGIQALRESAPIVLELPFNLLHAREEPS